MGFKKLWSKVARSLAIHRIVRLDYPFASQAASVKDGYATCEVLDRCCLRCFLGGILHGVNWPLLLVCLQHVDTAVFLQLREENTVLKQENEELRRKLERMNELLLKAQRAQFGQSSEKRSYVMPNQLGMFNEAEAEQDKYLSVKYLSLQVKP